MLRKAVLIAVLVGIGATGVASAGNGNDSRNDRRDDRYERRDTGRVDRNRGQGRWQAPPRQYAPPRYYAPPRPAPRYYGYAPAPRYVPAPRLGWREPYGRGYRYWQNNRYYYVEPGRPAVEFRLAFPLL